MNQLNLIIPAAGRGSRFSKNGIVTPKPLIDLNGKPFFWWATESVKQYIPIKELVFIVLKEHVESHQIDQKIKAYYPEANIVVIPDVTKGAAETALIGINALSSSGPLAINDCDHAFKFAQPSDVQNFMQSQDEGALITFRSSKPAYSYVKFNDAKQVIGTVEKQVVSDQAIAGCYFFKDANTYKEAYEIYIQACSYDEYFISGLYNVLAEQDANIALFELTDHCAFGTPPEYEAAKESIQTYQEWIR